MGGTSLEKTNARFFVVLPLAVGAPGRKGPDVSFVYAECSSVLQLF